VILSRGKPARVARFLRMLNEKLFGPNKLQLGCQVHAARNRRLKHECVDSACEDEDVFVPEKYIPEAGRGGFGS
jgi:hypothetical protein